MGTNHFLKDRIFWMDEILAHKEVEVRLFQGKSTATIKVEYARLPNDRSEGRAEYNSKIEVRKLAEKKLYDALKLLFGKNFNDDCIKRLNHIKHIVHSRKEVKDIQNNRYREIVKQYLDFQLLCLDCFWKLNAKRIGMQNSEVQKLIAMCKQLRNNEARLFDTNTYADSICEAKDTIIKFFSSYLALVDQISHHSIDDNIHTREIQKVLEIPEQYSIIKDLFPETQWLDSLASEEAQKNSVYQVSDLLKKDVEFFQECCFQNTLTDVYKIRYRLYSIVSENDQYKERANKDSEFRDFMELVSAVNTRIWGIVEDYRYYAENIEANDVMMHSELMALKALYALIEKSKIPESESELSKIMDGDTYEKIQEIFMLLAKDGVIFFYVDANKNNVDTVMVDVNSRLQYTLVYDILRMIKGLYINWESYIDVNKLLKHNDILMKSMKTFRGKLKEAESYYCKNMEPIINTLSEDRPSIEEQLEAAMRAAEYPNGYDEQELLEDDNDENEEIAHLKAMKEVDSPFSVSSRKPW